MEQRTVPVAEGGLLAALTVILALAAVYLPVIGIAAALLWPIPIIVLVVRHGVRQGVMAAVVAGIIMALFIDPVTALQMVISFMPTGIALGWGFRCKWSAVKTFLAAFAASTAAKLAAVLLLLFVLGVNVFDIQIDVMKQSMDASVELYRSMGIDEAQLSEMSGQMERMAELVSLLIPLIVILMGMLDAVISYMVGSKILKRLGERVPVMPPFASWHLPRWILMLFGFALVGMYWGTTRELDLLYRASLNLNLVCIFAGFVQGLSLLWYAADHWGLGKAIRIIIAVVLLFNGLLMYITALTGLFDMVFDYRARMARKKNS